MEKQTVAVLGPGSWEQPFHQSSMITTMVVSEKYQEQIDEINTTPYQSTLFQRYRY